MEQIAFALTIDQPFASLMAMGIKKVENRNWSPDESLIGRRIAIHAGRTYDYLGSYMVKNDHGIICHAAQFPRGAVVATATLKEVVTHLDDPWFRGPYGWIFDEIVMIEPLACSGRRHLWPLADELSQRLRQALDFPLQPWHGVRQESQIRNGKLI
ncbi:ASCH domain-containing protein [Deinococcus sp. HMF7620]|uniref:ASCH domain-containing protein n=1 Tax=Deinococcus arboris TaxID=2682977 RepID=A0A7C9MQL5_9DEIO|nr:ASCH domain-containing protein [Deinococcus arboris]MVN86564.1 ASCH domain-containing protein [Deinococcus arboris]